MINMSYSQEYESPTKPIEPGKAPGMKVKLLSSNAGVETYILVFSEGDEVRSGLTDFAKRYGVKAAHFTAIGDALWVKFGFFDYERKMFKIIPVSEPSEVASMNGNVTMFNGNPVVHIHATVATGDGTTRGGHILELTTGPTLEFFLTVEPATLHKKIDPKFGAALIDLSAQH